MFNLRNIEFKTKGFRANIIENNKEIDLVATEDRVNEMAYSRHKRQMLNLDFKLKEEYWVYLENDINAKITEFVYNHIWE